MEALRACLCLSIASIDLLSRGLLFPGHTNELVVLRHPICGEYGCRIRQMCVYVSPLQHKKIIELFLCP